MGFSDYLKQEQILFFHQTSKIDAIGKLSEAVSVQLPGYTKEEIIKAVWEREELLTTRIAPGIAIPHATFPGMKTTHIAVGISSEGILYDAKEDGTVHLLILLVGDEQTHLKALSEVATRLQVPGLYERLTASTDIGEVYTLLTSSAADISTSWEAVKLSRMICRQGVELAKAAGATVVVVHGSPDALSGVKTKDSHIRMLYVSNNSNEEELKSSDRDIKTAMLTVPFRGLNRSSQVEISLLLALSKGLVKKGEKVVSVFGLNTPSLIDTIVFTDIDREFKKFFSMSVENGINDIQQEVFIRVLQLATEIAHEGREGKPVGTLFVIGDYHEVAAHCQQMIANPFKGYEEFERNILDPGLSETIKEYAQIDGAFIIRGDGVIASAGTYLRIKSPIKNFPSGLGARHAAAAGITAATQAVAVAISESTRKLSLFSSGERIMEV